ncbi:MAG: long-chain fatty acid--CoA ligase [bacterium]
MEPRTWHRHYDPGVPPSIDGERVTMPETLRRTAQRFARKDAIRFYNGRMTWAELDLAVDRFAAALVRLGVVRGTRVAIQLPNTPQSVIAFLGTLRARGVCVMTNPLSMPPEIERQWTDAGCEVCVLADFLQERSLPRAARLPVREWIVASIPEYFRFPLKQLAPLKLRRVSPPLVADVVRAPNVHRFRPLLAAHAKTGESGLPLPSLDDLAALQYTGGTTGASKGAMLTHENFAAQAQQLMAWMPELVAGDEVFLSALPFFHVFGLTVGLVLPVLLGATMIIEPNPRDIARLIDDVNRHRVTIFPIVPALAHSIATHPSVRRLEVRSLKLCVSGSAPLTEETLQRFEKATGGRLVEGYGLTEACPVTHVNPTRGRRKTGTIGLPLPETDCRLVSIEDGVSDVPAGAEGELFIRGPQIMRGYWNRPEETRDALEDGWLHTGDLAVMDEDGYFRIVGRKKDMIAVGGYKVYPDEVDRALAEHADVIESATIGVPDARRGEIVKSFVVLRPGAHMDPDALRTFCRERLAAYKIPREIELRDSLPKSSVLKVLRRELLDEEMRRRGTAG